MVEIVEPTHWRRHALVIVTIEPPGEGAIWGGGEITLKEWHGPRREEVIEEATQGSFDAAMEYYRRERASRGWGG
jgi:hypothetical protein